MLIIIVFQSDRDALLQGNSEDNNTEKYYCITPVQRVLALRRPVKDNLGFRGLVLYL